MALEVNSKSVSLTALMDVHDAVVHVRLYLGLVQHALGKCASWSDLPRRIYTAGGDVNLEGLPLQGGI